MMKLVWQLIEAGEKGRGHPGWIEGRDLRGYTVIDYPQKTIKSLKL